MAAMTLASDSSAMPSPNAVSHAHPRHNSPSTTTSSSHPASDARRDPFPFSLTRSFRANPSSTSLVPSTAEGRPIPVDDSTAEHRTSALREINSHYPSRHRYAKSSGAQSSTYSEPVVVRSYRPPVHHRAEASARTGVVVHAAAGSGSDAGRPGAVVTRGFPFVSKVASGGNGMMGTMARVGTSKVLGAPVQQDARLPPVEAFSFKSFMANIEAQGGGGDINADLDRIAEICARSRYSLSNQYEVHYAPHGSGASFMPRAQQCPLAQGPTLQVMSDDEGNTKGQRRKRHAAGRNSRAMGTLETIISSSRSSSDEDKSNKKSAAETSHHVRERAARKDSGHSSHATSSPSSLKGVNLQGDEAPSGTRTRRPSTSLALIDGSRQNPTSGDPSVPRGSAASLVSEPALPQASTSQLELRTAPEQMPQACNSGKNKTTTAPPSDGRDQPVAKGSISSMQETGSGTGVLATLGNWIIPWGPSGKHQGRAEGSLRHLLKATDCKGKSVAKAA